MTPTNGWSEYKLVILRRLDDLEKAGRKRDASAEERHQTLMRMVGELRDDIVRIKANRSLQWLKVAGVSFVVAYAVAHGVSLWELLRGLL